MAAVDVIPLDVHTGAACELLLDRYWFCAARHDDPGELQAVLRGALSGDVPRAVMACLGT